MENEDKTLIMTPEQLASGQERQERKTVLCSCGGEMHPQSDRPGLLFCSRCGAMKQIASFDFTPGMVIGKYRLLQRLGSGGMGKVFLCCPVSDSSKRYAMKVLSNDFSENIEVSARRFQRESELLISMRHPAIIRTYEFWNDDNGFYSLMEYIDGKNLAQLRKEDCLFEEDIVLEIMDIVASAMLYAWDTFRILHRDIKPSNIMISNDNDVKVLDFGIARSIMEGTENSNLTMPGQGLGTPGFISPEQFRDARLLNCSSDIYGLGATVYYLFTGQEPYSGKSIGEVFSHMMQQDIVPAANLSSVPLSGPMQELLDKMLQKDPEKRISGWRKLQLNIAKVRQGQRPLL